MLFNEQKQVGEWRICPTWRDARLGVRREYDDLKIMMPTFLELLTWKIGAN